MQRGRKVVRRRLGHAHQTPPATERGKKRRRLDDEDPLAGAAGRHAAPRRTDRPARPSPRSELKTRSSLRRVPLQSSHLATRIRRPALPDSRRIRIWGFRRRALAAVSLPPPASSAAPEFLQCIVAARGGHCRGRASVSIFSRRIGRREVSAG
ncbi:hypothetical protein NL676_034004 [Syzygium grande]|nr:hypothetical protein NL676_034004 [Syzygium grande]